MPHNHGTIIQSVFIFNGFENTLPEMEMQFKQVVRDLSTSAELRGDSSTQYFEPWFIYVKGEKQKSDACALIEKTWQDMMQAQPGVAVKIPVSYIEHDSVQGLQEAMRACDLGA